MLILTLDDERLSLEALTDAVRQALPKAETRAYSNAFDALTEIVRDGLCPDAVFTDIEMPGMSGLELAQRIQRDTPSANIVFMTGYKQYALEAINMHCSGYVLKPATVEKIRAELRHMRIPFDSTDGALAPQGASL